MHEPAAARRPMTPDGSPRVSYNHAAATRRPASPGVGNHEGYMTGGGAVGHNRELHYGWERPGSARGQDRTAGGRPLHGGSAEPYSSTFQSVVRPHSARPETVQGKIGAVGGVVGSRLSISAPVRVQPKPPKAGAFRCVMPCCL